MLHLLPESYIQKLQKEYRLRSLIAACHLLSFCIFVLILCLLPTLLLVSAQKNQLEKQADTAAIRISDEDRQTALAFESSVKQGISILKNDDALSSRQVEYILSVARSGVRLNGISVIREDGAEQVQLQGIADTRASLSVFIRNIDAGGVYKTEEIPASTFTKDSNLPFNIVLMKVKKASQ